MPPQWDIEAQAGADLGERLSGAFDRLLEGTDRAVIIGSDSPDLPVQYIRRAFQRLKHKDVALGPATDGGYYLIGLRAAAPALFEGVKWGGPSVLADTLAGVEKDRRTLAMLPVWYDVDDEASLRTLETLVAARRLEGRDRLTAVESALRAIRG
jgi:rSAM/selenodomain-associated transferase 1